MLTNSLIGAIKRWQQAEGLPVTGVINIGDVIVLPGEVRISQVQGQVGDNAVEPLMSVTSTVKVVTVAVDSTDLGTIAQGDKVAITLPDSSTTSGDVASIGGVAVANANSETSSTPQQTVTVSLDDPAAVTQLDSATVQVAFTGQSVNGALAVPVGALLALSGGGYAVRLKNGKLIAVQVGMFAMGLVQITGDGIVPGLQVVTVS